MYNSTHDIGIPSLLLHTQDWLPPVPERAPPFMALCPVMNARPMHPQSLGNSLLRTLLRHVVLLLEEVTLDLGVLEQIEVPFCGNVSTLPRLVITSRTG